MIQIQKKSRQQNAYHSMTGKSLVCVSDLLIEACTVSVGSVAAERRQNKFVTDGLPALLLLHH